MGLVPFFTVRKWREVALRLPPSSRRGREVSGPGPGCPAGPAVCSQQALGGGSEPLGPSQGRWRSKQGWADSSWDTSYRAGG